MSDISINLGDALPYLEDKLRSLFGRSFDQTAARKALERSLRQASRDVATVQVVGMDRPIPLSDLYQPTRLVRRRDNRATTFGELVDEGKNVLILGGPGRGKTMLLRSMFAKLQERRDLLPLLFTLRWPNAQLELSELVSNFSNEVLQARKGRTKVRIVLLVDGLDEIPSDTRNGVLSSLREFESLEIGSYFLTCRSHYPVDDVRAGHWHVAPFAALDAERYVAAFAASYGSDFDPRRLIADLRERGFDDFVSHPLMLALVCILRSGPLSTLPSTSVGLLRRAVDTLTFRWDESKKIKRESRYDLDGDDRLHCLLRVAFSMKNLVEPEEVVVGALREQLQLLQRHDVSVDRLLEELAQWYGLLVPLDDGKWAFVHRTVHDYLAARFWVQSGQFNPDEVIEWDARAAYAACLTPDATVAMVRALGRANDVDAVIECLLNRAAFDVDRVAGAVVDHFVRVRDSGRIDRTGVISVSSNKPIALHASDAFLYALLRAAGPGTTVAHDIVLWCAIAELVNRGATIPRSTVEDVLHRFDAERYSVSVDDTAYEGLLSDLTPA